MKLREIHEEGPFMHFMAFMVRFVRAGCVRVLQSFDHETREIHEEGRFMHFMAFMARFVRAGCVRVLQSFDHETHEIHEEGRFMDFMAFMVVFLRRLQDLQLAGRGTRIRMRSEWLSPCNGGRMNSWTFERSPLVEKVLGCAIEVHKQLGVGLFESAYKECCAYEFTVDSC